VKLRWRQGGEEDRVVPPDCGLRPVGLGDRPDLPDRPGGADGRGLQGPRVAGDGLLDDEGAAELCHSLKPAFEGAEVSRPEDEAVDVLRQEAHPADLAVVRIGDGAVTGLEPILEPLAVEGGDVRPVTGGDDHLSHLAALLVVGAPLVGADVLPGEGDELDVEEVEPPLQVGGEVGKVGSGDDLADSVPQLDGPHPVAGEGGELPLQVGDDFGPGQGITLRFIQKGVSGSRIYIVCDLLDRG